MRETQKPTILIAEDDPISRRVLEAFVAKHGYDAISAENGRDALRLLSAEGAPRLAILDWMMPGMEGTDVCRKLREQSVERPYVYVLLLTARTDREDLLNGLQSGADDYITKPFDPAELHARLNVGRRIIDLQDKLIAAREELRFRATHDALTGVANRAVVLETLSREQVRHRREGRSFAVILMDIDHFKRVNDTYGHLCGDAVLREITSVMKRLVRPYDTVGRYGGEEFLIVVPESNAATAFNIAERIRRAIESRPIASEEGEIRVTVSFGVAANEHASISEPQTLLNLADEALYRAKRNGRNRTELATTPRPEYASAGTGSHRRQI
jgi:two-component system, cell cycle response regulator